ncbi:MAG: hypothetical protein AAF430_13780 [Myxococcota bacterium]
MTRARAGCARRVPRLRRRRGWLLAALGGVGLACASPVTVQSTTPDPPIEIDGAYDDWQGRFTRIQGKRSAGIGVAHDDDQVVLALVTRDLILSAMLQRGGFTLWFDPEGGDEPALGLRIAPHEVPLEEAVTPSLEIVFDGSEYGHQLAEIAPDGPVALRAAKHSDVLAYEFRVARGTALVPGGRRSNRFRFDPGPLLGLGLDVNPPQALPPSAGGGPFGGQGRGAAPEAVRLWLRVDLAPGAAR